MVWRDPIVEEVRAARKRLLKEAGGTLEGLIAMLREAEDKEPWRFVSLPPRRPRPNKEEGV